MRGCCRDSKGKLRSASRRAAVAFLVKSMNASQNSERIAQSVEEERPGRFGEFFSEYARSFWVATGLDLVLIRFTNASGHVAIGDLKTDFCRQAAGSRPPVCATCFDEAIGRFQRTAQATHTVCPFGLEFWIVPLAKRFALLTGRVLVTDSPGPPNDRRHPSPPRRTPAQVEAARSLLDLSLPHLRSQIALDELVQANRLSAVVSNACRYLEDHHDEPLDLARVAAACSVSPDHLSHRFADETGERLGRYLAAIRVGHALKLLKESSLPITEVCFAVGFQSVSQFNRCFRRLQGTSPAEFRKANA